MKNKFKKVVAVGTLASMLAVSGFAVESRPMLISNQYTHWAQSTVVEIVEQYKLEEVFENKDLDSVIKVTDFEKAVKAVINGTYEGTVEAVTREAIVNELVNIWGKQTDTDLAKVPVFAMIFYTDFEKITPEYNSGINIAYMKNIAKGRGDGIFAPKANVTYGELGALLKKTKAAINMEKEIDAINLETKGAVEIKDQKAIFDFELFNHSTYRKDITFSSGQQFELTIQNEKGNNVYKYSDGKYFTQALIEKSIEPGQALKWQNIWDMKDKDGKLVAEGNYVAKIDILVMNQQGEVQIPSEQLTKTIKFNIQK